MKRLSVIALSVVLALLLPVAVMAGGDVGEVATDFTCFDQNGDSHSLYDSWGHIILLNFGAFW